MRLCTKGLMKELTKNKRIIVYVVEIQSKMFNRNLLLILSAR